jgi:hypothetical protein
MENVTATLQSPFTMSRLLWEILCIKENIIDGNGVDGCGLMVESEEKMKVVKSI